ncbi:hypothetical protein NZD89_00420 [Alicyclobacillus fastidiosus]|uniref:Uncharacterized protein n=1 Tax=Alicyclobacillus fastidiosus TaxID=392011 RepID=A0ABY6ZH25_9BACL|nr:hypothetical protein [Alicyclobacillus fastidiosus]WAH42025.1 hypothetical protein NZD89_00420 [Alicyclobacillus fastidiosus]GMA63773.1 hypothetical protein GCM10025859_42130 [Alicyclobacillus fastidiosus]
MEPIFKKLDFPGSKTDTKFILFKDTKAVQIQLLPGSSVSGKTKGISIHTTGKNL